MADNAKREETQNRLLDAIVAVLDEGGGVGSGYRANNALKLAEAFAWVHSTNVSHGGGAVAG